MQYKNIQNITLKINEQQNILSNTSNNIKTLQNDINDKANKEHMHNISDINELQTNLTTLQNNINDKANKEHTHNINDINELQTNLTTLQNNKLTYRSYGSMQEMLDDWSNIPDGSCVMVNDGPDNGPEGGWDSAYVFKYNNLRVLTFAASKFPNDYIWFRAIGENSGSSNIASLTSVPFRKIPVLNTDGQLKCNSAALSGECVASNIKADNETRLAQCETNINNLKAEILKSIYPIGSIYTSMTNTSPATLFGFGTWTQITNRFLYCSSSSSKTTGGSEKHKHTTGDCTLTESQMPSHNHDYSQYGGFYITNGGAKPTGEWDGLKLRSERPDSDIHTVYTAKRGGGQAHNHGNTGEASNMPPYITVYCWYRVE